MNHEFLPGVRFVPHVFAPTRGIYQGKRCEGVSLLVTDRGSLSPMLMGIEIAATLEKLYPGNFKIGRVIQLLGSRSTLEQLEGGVPPPDIVASWGNQIDRFRQIRKKYLIYPGD